MKQLIPIFLLVLFAGQNSLSAQHFADAQLQATRVSIAKADKDKQLREECSRIGIDFDEITNIYLRGLKQEEILEVWVQQGIDNDYVLFKEYQFCATSGKLGPKREQGDGQIPEGFYFIDHFNSTSNYYLSLGVNYPNPSDVVEGNRASLGGSIYIHGACETIGCIPITDDKIKELYWLSVVAKDHGQKHIPVHIFPYKFDQNTPKPYNVYNINDPDMLAFWDDIEPGYYHFEQYRKPPFVVINADGSYDFY